jgi:hypothetical protein
MLRLSARLKNEARSADELGKPWALGEAWTTWCAHGLGFVELISRPAMLDCGALPFATGLPVGLSQPQPPRGARSSCYCRVGGLRLQAGRWLRNAEVPLWSQKIITPAEVETAASELMRYDLTTRPMVIVLNLHDIPIISILAYSVPPSPDPNYEHFFRSCC